MGFHLRRPSDALLQRHLAEAADAPFTYAPVGATRDPARLVQERFERRFDVDHHRTRLGSGRELFERACAALRSWAPFDQRWITLVGREVAPAERVCVAVLAHTAPLWSANACRIAYVLEESEPVARFAFAYGTLPGHVERGEERFAVEWQPGNDEVHFDLLAISRPQHPLARLGRPLARRLQARFGRGALAAMRRAIA